MKKLNLKLTLGQSVFYGCGRMKTIAKAIRSIKQRNKTHKSQLEYTVMGGGISIRRVV